MEYRGISGRRAARNDYSTVKGRVKRMTTSKFRGYEIEEINGELVFSDTKEPTAQSWKSRPCGHCGKCNTQEGHDGCLGTLPNVMNACCGHGEVGEAYVQYRNGESVRGKDAISLIGVIRND